MIYVGKNIISVADKLQKVEIEYLYNRILKPRPDIEAKIRQLRIVRSLDLKQYNNLKKTLPYFVCASFNPLFRKTENFLSTQYFVLDFDHFSDKEMNVDLVFKKLISDEQVFLCFRSPSADGIKVLFRLEEKCFDRALYSLFYKRFLIDFSKRLGLEQVIDSRTSDVTRAVFISADAEAYYNPAALFVKLSNYVDQNSCEALFDLKKNFKKEMSNDNERPQTVEKSVEPEDELMLKIRSLLNPKARVKKEIANVFVPNQLNEIMGGLNNFILEQGIELLNVINIQYGKKMRFRLGRKEAEINLFFGKKGFTVVASPKSGTSAELNDLMYQLISNYIFDFLPSI